MPLEQPLGAISNLLKWPTFLPEQVSESVGSMGSSAISVFVRNITVCLVRDLLKVLSQLDTFCINVELNGSGGAFQPGICQGDAITDAGVGLWNLIMQRTGIVCGEIFANNVIV
jgi:hypothetical protein